jgi:hypothetical protein
MEEQKKVKAVYNLKRREYYNDETSKIRLHSKMEEQKKSKRFII